jgi:hypothetical protein
MRAKWLGRLMGQDHWKDLSVGRRIILKYILREQDGKVWTRFTWLGYETIMGFC